MRFRTTGLTGFSKMPKQGKGLIPTDLNAFESPPLHTFEFSCLFPFCKDTK